MKKFKIIYFRRNCASKKKSISSNKHKNELQNIPPSGIFNQVIFAEQKSSNEFEISSITVQKIGKIDKFFIPIVLHFLFHYFFSLDRIKAAMAKRNLGYFKKISPISQALFHLHHYIEKKFQDKKLSPSNALKFLSKKFFCIFFRRGGDLNQPTQFF